MEADWDLHAVVRGCCSTTTATTTTTSQLDFYDHYSQQKSTLHDNSIMEVFPDLYHPTSDNSIEHFLNNLYNPLQLASFQNQPTCSKSLPVSPLSVLGGLQDPPYYQQKQQKQQQVTQFQGKQQALSVSRCTSSIAQSTTKFKKRKNQVKTVCQVPAEGTSTSSSDLWSWRKYGQKPIKGSPYPSLKNLERISRTNCT
ncbi:WRKY transcription factor 22-like protein [Tanacetum coccineum]